MKFIDNPIFYKDLCGIMVVFCRVDEFDFLYGFAKGIYYIFDIALRVMLTHQSGAIKMFAAFSIRNNIFFSIDNGNKYLITGMQ